ncbi:STAS domain-containing protein [Saccharomonospora sp. NPDC006951]|nr:STAS domain-containing protein [Prauserella marina]
MFSITVAHTSTGCALVTVVGEIDAGSMIELGPELERLPDGVSTAVVVDLSRVPYCSCSGVGMFVELLSRTRHDGVPLALVIGTHAVRRAFEVLDVSRLFAIRDDHTSALSAVRMAA